MEASQISSPTQFCQSAVCLFWTSHLPFHVPAIARRSEKKLAACYATAQRQSSTQQLFTFACGSTCAKGSGSAWFGGPGQAGSGKRNLKAALLPQIHAGQAVLAQDPQVREEVAQEKEAVSPGCQKEGKAWQACCKGKSQTGARLKLAQAQKALSVST